MTVVVPTTERRHQMHSLLNHSFFSQIYPAAKLSMLVDDAPSSKRSPLADYWAASSRVHYRQSKTQHQPLGQRRNQQLDEALGRVVVHFDDDDFYGPWHIRRMVEYLLEHSDARLVKLSGWFGALPRSVVSGSEIMPNDGISEFGRRFITGCFCLPPWTGWGWTWAFFKSRIGGCRYASDLSKGEEDSLQRCLHEAHGESSVHSIGDEHATVLKLQDCQGVTSLGYKVAYDLPPWLIDQYWGNDTVAMLEQLYLPHIAWERCASYPAWTKERSARALSCTTP